MFHGSFRLLILPHGTQATRRWVRIEIDEDSAGVIHGLGTGAFTSARHGRVIYLTNCIYLDAAHHFYLDKKDRSVHFDYLAGDLPQLRELISPQDLIVVRILKSFLVDHADRWSGEEGCPHEEVDKNVLVWDGSSDFVTLERTINSCVEPNDGYEVVPCEQLLGTTVLRLKIPIGP